MCKKMKLWAAGTLGVMLAGLVSVNVYALDAKDVVGTWYVNGLSIDGENTFHPEMMGMEITFNFTEDGKGEMTNAMEYSDPEVEEMEWKIDGDKVLITKNDETVEGEYSDGTISMDADGMYFIMNQEKEEYEPYVPGNAVEEPKLEDFNGEWKSTLMDAFGMQMPTAAGLSDVEMTISISDGKASLVMIESAVETKVDLEGDLEGNALILKSTTEKEEDSESYTLVSTDVMKFYLLEDGNLCFTTEDSMDDEASDTVDAADTADTADTADATDAEEALDGDDEYDFGDIDFTIKIYFEKLVVE